MSVRVLTWFFLFKDLFIHSPEVGSLIKEAHGCSHWFLSLHSVVSSLQKPLLTGYFKKEVGAGDFPQDTMNMDPGYFQRKIKEKIEPKEPPSCLIPRLR